MSLGPAQDLLFGDFEPPRVVGNPVKSMLYGPGYLEDYIESNWKKNNIYACIGQWDFGEDAALNDKIFFDLDGAKEETFEDGITETRKIELMRENRDIAHEVLGQSCRDAKKLAWYARKKGIPMMCVFTGFGIHVYFFYQERIGAKNELLSTVNYIEDKLNLRTVDPQPIGDVKRISKVPNCPRVTEQGPVDLYAIPFSRAETRSIRPEWLLRKSKGERPIEEMEPFVRRLRASHRPEMQVYEDHMRKRGRTNPDWNLDYDSRDLGDEHLEWYIEQVIPMPCMQAAVLSSDPPHPVRVNFAIMMFNTGHTPAEVKRIIQRLNWTDFDAEKTKRHLKSIWRNGYPDKSCKDLDEMGLCQYQENQPQCPVYGWQGGTIDY